MKTFFTFSLFLLIPVVMFAQGDMLLLKKRGRVVNTFFEGSEIMFNVGFGMQKANIYHMKKDSLFLVQYQVVQRMTSLGVYILDTAAAYRSAINYRDIRAIGKEGSPFWNSSGAALFGGGTLLTTAGLITWIFAKPNTRYYARPALVITSAALAAAGYLMMKSSGKKMVIGKKYSLQYISPK